MSSPNRKRSSGSEQCAMSVQRSASNDGIDGAYHLIFIARYSLLLVAAPHATLAAIRMCDIEPSDVEGSLA
jgi:hypothetical protein